MSTDVNDFADNDKLQAWKKEVEQEIINSFDDIDSPLREAVLHYPRAGGKCVRPIFLFSLAEMMGGSDRDVFNIGVGLEMIHVATLIGDDHPVMDDDDKRRGVESVHKKYDKQRSLLASNLLLSAGIHRCQSQAETIEQSKNISTIINRLVAELNQGQYYDVSYMGNDEIVPEEKYMSLVRSKTAQIYAAAGELAVLFTDSSELNGKREQYRSSGKQLGKYVGISHQLFDDVMDFREEGNKKEVYSDIRTKTNTIVTIHAKKNDCPVFDDTIPVSKRAEMVREAGSLEYGKQKGDEYIQKAFNELKQLPVKNEQSLSLIQSYLEILRNY